MNTAIFITVMVIIGIMVAGIIYGAYWYFSTVTTIQAENTYCTNWFNNLEDRRIQMESAGFWESMNYDYDQYNAEVAEYNRECYY